MCKSWLLESLVYSAHGEPLGVTHNLVVRATEVGGDSIEYKPLRETLNSSLCLSTAAFFPRSASTAHFLPSATTHPSLFFLFCEFKWLRDCWLNAEPLCVFSFFSGLRQQSWLNWVILVFVEMLQLFFKWAGTCLTNCKHSQERKFADVKMRSPDSVSEGCFWTVHTQCLWVNRSTAGLLYDYR